MKITFSHFSGKAAVQVAATVVFNAEQVWDMMLVVPNSHMHELGDIITFFRTANNYWWSDSLARLLYPKTFANLLGKLTVLFKGLHFKFLEDEPDT